MLLVEWSESAARTIGDERLEKVTLAPLTTPLRAGSSVQVACFRIAPGGRIARHPATVPQIFAVLDGSAAVSGEDGVERTIVAGQAVFWEMGESHETRSETGLTAIVVEGEGIRPFERPGAR